MVLINVSFSAHQFHKEPVKLVLECPVMPIILLFQKDCSKTVALVLHMQTFLLSQKGHDIFSLYNKL